MANGLFYRVTDNRLNPNHVSILKRLMMHLSVIKLAQLPLRGATKYCAVDNEYEDDDEYEGEGTLPNLAFVLVFVLVLVLVLGYLHF
jgi:hypothetical protein